MLAQVSLGQAQKPHMDQRPCCGIVSVSFEPLVTRLGDGSQAAWGSSYLELLLQLCNIRQFNIGMQLEDRELKQPPLRGSWSLCRSSRLGTV